VRRLITGFLFGTTGALIAISPVGERSGAHVNPIVTLAFRLFDKIDLRTTLGYIVAQLVRCDPEEPAAAGLGRDGPERGVRRHAAAGRLRTRDRPARRGHHDVHDGHAAVRVPRLPPDPPVRAGEMSRQQMEVHLILNAYWEALPFDLPPAAGAWRRWIDTSLPSPRDIEQWTEAPPVPDHSCRVGPRSVVVLYALAG
jgi:hypothetical protein